MVEHTPFLKKIAACQSVSQSVSVCVCEIVKLSGFERPQKKAENPKNFKKKKKRIKEEIDVEVKEVKEREIERTELCVRSSH